MCVVCAWCVRGVCVLSVRVFFSCCSLVCFIIIIMIFFLCTVSCSFSQPKHKNAARLAQMSSGKGDAVEGGRRIGAQ